MKSRTHERKKKTRQQTPDTTAQAKPMFQSRPFEVQSPKAERSHQPDLKTAIQRAERYGHHPNRSQGEDNATKSKQTIGGRGMKKADLGIDIGSTKGVVQRASDIEGEENSSPLSSPPSSSDKEAEQERPMDGMSRLRRAHERAQARTGNEQREIGSRQPFDSKTGGIARVSRGGMGGNQAMVTTNKKDHPGTTNPGMSYRKVSSSLGEQGFQTLGKAYSGEEVGPLSPQTTRNTAMMHGLLHAAEPHRDPGADKLGRAAVRRVAQGDLPQKEFPQAFPMALPGGSQSLKRAREGKKPLSKTTLETADQMSTSSNTSSDEEKKPRRKKK